MAVTLKMISERIGLSQAAVSQILNRKPNDLSSEETKKRVFAIAEELGYKQKFGHKLLRGDSTGTVALLIDMKQLTNEEHIQRLIIKLLTDLEQSGRSSYLSFLGHDEKKNLEAIGDLAARGADSFIVIGSATGEKAIEEEFLKLKKNFVGFGTELSRDVTVSCEQSVKAVLDFFASEGKTNFKFLLLENFYSSARFKAFRKYFPQLSESEVVERFCVAMPRTVVSTDTMAQIGYETTEFIFQKDPTVSALFYLSDYFAVGGLNFLLKSGRIPGKDVLVAGYNNIHAVRTCFFPVSTAEHPIDESAESLLAILNQNNPCKKIIYSKAIIRKESSFTPQNAFHGHILQ
ncbi:MAG: LacI family DNA-binding transcriptional regulator [Lentisphaeria bacterium]|nr:LacI family DNA-binding transcriptional regulator [Lentisphaeria bacterium]